MGTAVVHRLEWVDVDVVCPCEPHAAATRMQSYGRSKLPARFSCSRVAARRTHRRRDSVATKCSVSLSVPTRRASVLVLHSLHDAARFFRVYSLKLRGKGRLHVWHHVCDQWRLKNRCVANESFPPLPHEFSRALPISPPRALVREKHRSEDAMRKACHFVK